MTLLNRPALKQAARGAIRSQCPGLIPVTAFMLFWLLLQRVLRDPLCLEPLARAAERLELPFFLPQLHPAAGGVLFCLAALVTIPVFAGFTGWVCLAVHQNRAGFLDLFEFFRTPRAYLRALGGYLYLALRFLCSLAAVTLALAVLLASGAFLAVKLLRLGAILPIILMVAIAIVAWLVLLSYYMVRAELAYCLMVYHPDLTVLGSHRQTRRLLSGRFQEAALFGLSFIGWQVLCALTWGLACCYYFPYRRFSVAMYASFLMRDEPEEASREF